MSSLVENVELDPGGGTWERLHESRREIVELCGEKGKTIFLFLLTSSTPHPDREDIAVVSHHRLLDIALQLGSSPDTVKRYTAIFRAVKLVHHYHDRRREVALHIPLGPYTPLTNLVALDDLIRESRKKQRQLAIKFKVRYITRFGDPTQAHSDEIQKMLLELKAILEDEHLENLKRQRLQIKIADLLTHLVGQMGTSTVGDLNQVLDDLEAAHQDQPPGIAPKKGDSNPKAEVLHNKNLSEQKRMHTQLGDSDQQAGDLIPYHTNAKPQKQEKMGDSDRLPGDLNTTHSSASAHQSEQAGDSDQMPGDPLHATEGSSSSQDETLEDSNQLAGDLVLQQNVQQPHKDDHLGDSNAQAVLKVGDSNLEAVVEVHASAPATYNVNYLISNISNNVKRNEIAKFLAGVLEKHEYENGKPTFRKYLAAFKQYTPEVIGRAFLATMVLLHCKRWRVNSRGATFTNQCKTLSGQQPFVHYSLEEVEEWLQAWGHLPYAELITALAAAPLSEPAASEPAPLVTTPRQHVAPPSPAQSSNKRGLPGHFGAATGNKKKRTYGMHYTGLPSAKGFNSSGAYQPPQSTEKS
jgi:hypothetical protein